MTDSKPLIVMADDDEDDLMFARESFEACGVSGKFVTFSGGNELIQFLFESRVPDLILLDINMPLVDGYAVVEKIAGVERFHAIPVVVLSTSSEEHSDAERLRRADAYYVKPATYKGWIKMMKEITGRWVSGEVGYDH